MNILKLLRVLNDHTQSAIASETLGINQNTYSRIEHDPAKITVTQADKLAKFYGISLNDLVLSTIVEITISVSEFEINTMKISIKTQY